MIHLMSYLADIKAADRQCAKLPRNIAISSTTRTVTINMCPLTIL